MRGAACFFRLIFPAFAEGDRADPEALAVAAEQDRVARDTAHLLIHERNVRLQPFFGHRSVGAARVTAKLACGDVIRVCLCHVAENGKLEGRE